MMLSVAPLRVRTTHRPSWRAVAIHPLPVCAPLRHRTWSPTSGFVGGRARLKRTSAPSRRRRACFASFPLGGDAFRPSSTLEGGGVRCRRRGRAHTRHDPYDCHLVAHCRCWVLTPGCRQPSHRHVCVVPPRLWKSPVSCHGLGPGSSWMTGLVHPLRCWSRGTHRRVQQRCGAFVPLRVWKQLRVDCESLFRCRDLQIPTSVATSSSSASRPASSFIASRCSADAPVTTR